MKIQARLTPVLGIILVALVAGGCSRPVLKQDIPVSTNPMGARIYANGQLVGTTPGTVSLERNRSHILTLLKDNYRQEDVTIVNQYQKEKVYLKAVQSGIHSGLFFKNSAMGVQSGMSSLSSQEETGEAFVLAPPAVRVNLTPLAGAATHDPANAPSGAGAEGVSASQPSGVTEAPPMDRSEFSKELLKIGAGAAASQIAPVGKRVETSSSSKTYVTPGGTRVQEKSSTSVGVGINPAGLIDVIDLLFK
jgi:hypothetical protein